MKYDYSVFENIINKYTGRVPFIKEYKFHPERRWRIDYAHPAYRLAIEVEGGVWMGGRHTRSKGFIKDLEKYNELNLLGWTLLRFTPDQLLTYGITCIDRFFHNF